MTRGIDPTLAARLGRRIREIRTARGLTVGALAGRSDVSRRMLTLIELGQANPSIASLDRIADGLGTTFAALVGVGQDQHPKGVEVWATPAGGRRFLLSAMETPDYVIELWKCILTPSDRHTGGPGAAGSEAMHHVVSGELLIATGGRAYRIAAGDSVAVPLGHERAYTVTSDDNAVFFEVFPQPRKPRT